MNYVSGNDFFSKFPDSLLTVNVHGRGITPISKSNTQACGPAGEALRGVDHKTENMVATDHAKVMRFLSQPQTLEQIEAGFDAVQKAGASGDSDQLNAVRRPNFIRVPRSRLRGE